MKKKKEKEKKKKKKKNKRDEAGIMNLREYGSFIAEDKKEKKKKMIDRVGVFKRLPIDPLDYMHYTPDVQDQIVKRYI